MVEAEMNDALILIVDDTPANIKILSATLKATFNIAFAKNGPKALEYVRKNTPDLILLDIKMPEMDGYDVCRHLKEDPKTQHIPVIFITVLKDSDDKTKGFELGAVDYITKPFDQAEVRSRVKTHVMLKRYQERLEELVTKRTSELLTAKSELEEKATHLKEVNTTLKVLLAKREEDKAELEENILNNITKRILPYIEKIRIQGTAPQQLAHINLLESNLNDLISPFSSRLSTRFLNFTPTEIQVADLIKKDKSTKEIAAILNLSTHTIDSHRKHIRDKLGIANKKASLKTHLMAITE